jgi:hypothetical protein
LKEEFGSENVRFNGLSEQSERLPNTCNVSFIASDQYKGYLILQKAQHLEASTGAWYVFFSWNQSYINSVIDSEIKFKLFKLSLGRVQAIEDFDRDGH